MSPIRMSRLESAVRVVLEFNEAFNRHDVAHMMRLMSDDCVLESAGPTPDGVVHSGKAAVARFWQEFFGQAPQVRSEIEEIVGLGDRCILRWKWEWVEGAAEKGHVRGIDLFRVKNGCICEKLSYIKA